jgi:tartrate dehydratase alpha subunit/fumarate hydratase class I-like protein
VDFANLNLLDTALAAMDLTQAKVGKLCADTGSFVIEETLGELEFEAEENEVTLNLNKAVTAEGEWGKSLINLEALHPY